MPLTGLPDEKLVALVAKADKEALAVLYDKYVRLVFSLAVKILQDKELAEEVTQETFLLLWRRANSYQPHRGKFSSWLLSIAHNRVIDELRRLRRSREVQGGEELRYPEPNDETLDAIEQVEREARSQTVREAIAQLSASQQQVLNLAYFQGLTQVEVAEKLSIPLGTVKTRMRLGLQKLKAALQAQNKEFTAL